MARPSTIGPNVNVPSTWQHHGPIQPSQSSGSRYLTQSLPSSSNPQAVGTRTSGYSAHHAHYGSEHERWRKLSYAVPPAQTISLEITAVHEGGVRRKGSRGITIGVCVLSLEI
jgi:hypothetical protein